MGKGIFSGMLKNLQTPGEMQQIKGGKASALNKGLPIRLNAPFRFSFSSIHPLLDFQQRMKRKCKCNNPETVMRVKQMPGNVQITSLPDGISPDSASCVFNENPHEPEKWKGLSLSERRSSFSAR
jgi:hypothetical protein